MEACREELGRDYRKCGKPAEFILWGKLLKPEALGPRCYECAAKHVGHSALYANSGWAIFNLRPVDPFFAALASSEDRASGAA